MRARRTGNHLRRLRRVLLLGVVGFVALLFGLYLFGRRPSGDVPAGVASDQAPIGEEIVIGNNFHYEVTEEGVTLWEIDADRLVSTQDGRYSLEGVAMAAQREDDKAYSIRAERGEYDLEANEARLTGNVVIEDSRGLRLETEGLQLVRKGHIVLSDAPVDFKMGEIYEGRANRLEVHFPRDRIRLAGRVEIRTAPGIYPTASIDARRIVVFRDTHNIVAEGSPDEGSRLVDVRHGRNRLVARRISLNFDENDDEILFALASWQVQASFEQDDGDGVPTRATVEGDKLSVVFSETTGDPERLEMDAPAGGLARLTQADESGLIRSMEADYLWADFAGGRVRSAQGMGGVTLEERLRHAPEVLLHQVCSESVEALYDAAGEITRLELRDSVSFAQRDLQAGGSRLTAVGDEGPVELVGRTAWVSSRQGRLEAPRIEIDRVARQVRAEGGVRAEMAEDSSPDLEDSDEAQGPVRVQADSAVWTDEPREVEFRDEVRAWQGESFLVSDTLGMEEGDLLASGNVRSVWHEREPVGAATAAEDGSAAEEPQPPVQISSDDMRFDRELGRLIYDGNAKVVQGPKSMACPRLQLQMDDNEDFERMYCEAGTKIDDGEAGNRLSGDVAIFNQTVGKVKVMGEPVRMNQADGGSISARLMIYDFDTGIAEIDSVASEEADLYMSAEDYFAQRRAELGLPEEPVDGQEAPAATGETDGGGAGTGASEAETEADPVAAAPPDADGEGA